MSRRSRYARVHAHSRAARGNPTRRDQAAPPADSMLAGPAPAVPAPASRTQMQQPGEPSVEEADFSEVVIDEPAVARTNGHATDTNVAAAAGPSNGHGNGANGAGGCTAPQLRRFIKSRSYVPMHELRRRFGINGGEDDVTLLDMDGHHIFVGLPVREGRLLGELLRGGDVGYELSLDPLSPVVVGVYPMRPVPRP